MKVGRRYRLPVVSKYWGYIANDYSYHCLIVRMKVVERVNPKSFHHRKKMFFWYLYEMIDVNLL